GAGDALRPRALGTDLGRHGPPGLGDRRGGGPAGARRRLRRLDAGHRPRSGPPPGDRRRRPDLRPPLLRPARPADGGQGCYVGRPHHTRVAPPPRHLRHLAPPGSSLMVSVPSGHTPPVTIMFWSRSASTWAARSSRSGGQVVTSRSGGRVTV